ncbi:MAG: hypothetical protein IKS66_00790 [Oscillospiraceae bacterium]|nr:hypothetical protein [Oscillospiraceae bacterium]
MRAHLKKLRRSIETLPRHIYLFLKGLLLLADGQLLASALLFALGRSHQARHLARLCLETPAAVLLMGLLGLAFLLDRSP